MASKQSKKSKNLSRQSFQELRVLSLLQGGCIKSASYNASLTDKKREEVQKDWITDKFKVVCSTIAIGKRDFCAKYNWNSSE